MAEEIVNTDNDGKNPVIEDISNRMMVHIMGPEMIQLEFPVLLNLKVGEDLAHYTDLVQAVVDNGVMYMAQALWQQAQMLAPVMEGDSDKAAPAKEVEAEVIE